MKKYPFPIRCHSGLKPTITQVFGSTQNAEWYHSLGISPIHNAIDFVLGNPTQSYGAELINTFTESTYIKKVWWDTPMATQGNGIDFSNGVYSVRFWHCSEIVKVSGKVKFGETLALMGNSGIVRPEPSYGLPFSGTHCHMIVYRNDTGDPVDPLDVFDINNLIYGKNTGFIKDIPPFNWAIQGITNVLNALKKKLGYN